MSIAVCIATMGRFSFLKESIPQYLKNPYVSELIITDETGEDYEAITATFSHPKLRVYKNESRLGIPANKIHAASHALSDYICILDSDNYADIHYFEAFHRFLDGTRTHTASMFLPSVARPNFNYKEWVGIPLTRHNVKQFYPNIYTCLNTMNLILPRVFFQTFNIMSDVPMCNEIGPYDGIYFALYALFELNATLYIVDGMEYEHRVHAGSTWTNTHKESEGAFHRLLERYLHR